MAPTLDLRQDSPTAANSWMVGDGHALPAVVGALDGSEASRLTTAVAARLARRMTWRLALVPVPLGATAEDQRDRLVAAALDERAGLIATPATNSASADGPGAPACLALADTAPCPVLAVPLTGRGRPTAGGSVVCGVDGSQRSAAAARTAARLAMALGARLELVHVATRPENGADPHRDPSGAFTEFLWRAPRTLDAMPHVDLVLEAGDPAGRLSTLAESKRALLVIGAPANPTAEHGVASTLMAKSHVHVVVVPGPP
jgi:nucleotide-binding universal stress UspA family protein